MPGRKKPDKVMLETFSSKLRPFVADREREKFGEKIGVRGTMISDYLSGKSIPRGDILLAISRETRKPMEWFLTEPEEDPGRTESPRDVMLKKADAVLSCSFDPLRHEIEKQIQELHRCLTIMEGDGMEKKSEDGDIPLIENAQGTGQ